jgi:hypothetical protein
MICAQYRTTSRNVKRVTTRCAPPNCSEPNTVKPSTCSTPTTGLHPADVERLQRQLQKVEAGNTVIVIEHDMPVISSCD